MKVFLDANVILDYLTDRQPFADDAEAVRWNAEAIVTRDKNGFTGSSIPVFTPADFIAKYA